MTRCATAETCAGSAGETVSEIAYDTVSTSAGGNLLPLSVTARSGNTSGAGAVSATTTLAHDAAGNLTRVDGPLAGTVDVAGYQYDKARRRTASIAPDPDGAGPRKRRAESVAYDDAGRVTSVTTGVVAGLTETDWAAFQPYELTSIRHDAYGRETSRIAGGSATFALSETSYDNRGRVRCQVLRMDPASYSGSPPDARTPRTTPGAFGPDRVTRLGYDATGRQSKVESGVGTDAEAVDAEASYTANGQVATLEDGKGNSTGYAYDGLDRLQSVTWPTVGGVSPTESYAHDAADAVATFTDRAGQTTSLTRDLLGRVTDVDLPSGVDLDIAYSYDLLGRTLSARDISGGIPGHGSTYTYDALGRVTSEATTWATKTMAYDAAGRRTKLTWQDGFYVDYDWDDAGALKALRENGAASGAGVLATFSYDDLGRRTGITRGNGTSSSYAYDGASRLSSLGHDFAGTTHDVSTSFSHNPAFQIAGRTGSNTAYSFARTNVDRTASFDAQNRITGEATTSFGHDVRGNLTTGLNGQTYAYNARNLMYQIPGGIYNYDALGRLNYISANSQSATATLLDHDGWNLVAEYAPGGTVLKRYVHGAGMDEPLVEYDGSGTTSKTWLHADERGSIVARSNASGVLTAVNRYDDYGQQPATGNVGRFRYTGQAWLPEAQLYNYKARMYAPGLGRFMQTDPIGYADGTNLYGYVGGDPVNLVDPTGMQELNSGDTSLCGPGVAQTHPSCDIIVTGELQGKLFHGWSHNDFYKPDLGFDFGEIARPGTWSMQQTSEPPRCPSTNTTAGRIASKAQTVGLVADGVTIAAGIVGLATAPSGVGPVGAGIVAVGGRIVSSVSNIVALGANLIDKNYSAAKANAAGIVVGRLGQAAATSASNRIFVRQDYGASLGQERAARTMADMTGSASGNNASAIVCR